MPAERLQKVLANQGIASRRTIESWIEAGRIKVNGKVAELGCRINPDDKILLDNKPLKTKQTANRTRVIIYHKPVGEISSRHDPEGRETVYQNLPKIKGARWISIGRLDLNTSGLLLFTTNGELANRLMHPSYEMERIYAVRVFGEVSDEALSKLLTGVELEDGMARFDNIDDAGGSGLNHWYHVTLREGRNREVRRLWEAVGCQVSRLMRIKYAGIEMPSRLAQGRWQELQAKEVGMLLKAVGMEIEQIAPARKSKKKPARKRK